MRGRNYCFVLLACLLCLAQALPQPQEEEEGEEVAGEEVAGEEEAAAGDEEEEAAAGDEEEEEDNLVGATALKCSKSKLRLLKG